MDPLCKNVLTELLWCPQPPAGEGPRSQGDRYFFFSNTDLPHRVRVSINPGSPRLTTRNSPCLRKIRGKSRATRLFLPMGGYTTRTRCFSRELASLGTFAATASPRCARVGEFSMHARTC